MIPHIHRTTDSKHLEACAAMMCASDPWKTLGRTYDQCLKAVSGDEREVYIVLEEATIQGFAVLLMSGIFKGYIQSVCVSPGYRNKGIGSALLRFCEERIFRDSPNVFLCVSSFNPSAQKLYGKLGYETVGELKDFIVRGHSELLLRKTTGPLAEFRPTL